MHAWMIAIATLKPSSKDRYRRRPLPLGNQEEAAWMIKTSASNRTMWVITCT